jgi:hypothetical protein
MIPVYTFSYENNFACLGMGITQRKTGHQGLTDGKNFVIGN